MTRRRAESEIGQDGQTQRVTAQLVSDNYFDVLGVDAAAGRVFHAGAAPARRRSPIAVISDGYWRRAVRRRSRRRSARRSAIAADRPSRSSASRRRGFKGVELEAAVDVWFLFDQVVPPDSHATGRGAAGSGRRPAGRRRDAEQAARRKRRRLLGRPVIAPARRPRLLVAAAQLYRPLLLVVLVVVLVLLITCTNLAT